MTSSPLIPSCLQHATFHHTKQSVMDCWALCYLSCVPAPASVQVFGIRKCADTRKALRFFSDRRIPVHFVDLKERPASPGELRRFVQKFGVEALLDREAPAFRDGGLRHTRLSDDGWIEKLASQPSLLRTPLVRNGNELSVGAAEEVWKAWTARKE